MLNIVKHFWLLITVKKYIKKYKLKVKVRNHLIIYELLQLLTVYILSHLHRDVTMEKKSKKLGEITLVHKLFYWHQMWIIEKYSMNISNS